MAKGELLLWTTYFSFAYFAVYSSVWAKTTVVPRGQSQCWIYLNNSTETGSWKFYVPPLTYGRWINKWQDKTSRWNEFPLPLLRPRSSDIWKLSEERSQLRCFGPLRSCFRRVHPGGDHGTDLRHVGEVVSVAWPGNAKCLGLTA